MPLPQPEAEAGLIASLMRRYGEDASDALTRATTLPIGITRECIEDSKWSNLFQATLDNAVRDIPTSVALAAQATQINEFELRQLVENTDVDALPLYADRCDAASGAGSVSMGVAGYLCKLYAPALVAGGVDVRHVVGDGFHLDASGFERRACSVECLVQTHKGSPPGVRRRPCRS